MDFLVSLQRTQKDTSQYHPPRLSHNRHANPRLLILPHFIVLPNQNTVKSSKSFPLTIQSNRTVQGSGVTSGLENLT